MLRANPDLQDFSKIEVFLTNIAHFHSIPAINWNKDTSHIPPKLLYIPNGPNNQDIVANLEEKKHKHRFMFFYIGRKFMQAQQKAATLTHFEQTLHRYTIRYITCHHSTP